MDTHTRGRLTESDLACCREIHPTYDTLDLQLVSTLCFQDLSIQRGCRFAKSSRLFLAESRRALVFELLVEGVTVTDGGDVVALESKYGHGK